jgi:hypothetical protein
MPLRSCTIALGLDGAPSRLVQAVWERLERQNGSGAAADWVDAADAADAKDAEDGSGAAAAAHSTAIHKLMLRRKRGKVAGRRFQQECILAVRDD